MRWQGGVGGRPRRPGRPGCWENKGHRPVLPNKSEDLVQPHSPRLLHVREKQTALVTAAATTRQGSLSRSSSQRGGHTVWQHLHHFPVPPTPHEGPGPRLLAPGPRCPDGHGVISTAVLMCVSHEPVLRTPDSPVLWQRKSPHSWSSGLRGLQLGGASGPRVREVCEGSQETDEKQ